MIILMESEFWPGLILRAHKNKIPVLVRQIAGYVARRIVYYVKEGDSVKQGAEFGFIKFGSRVDLFLPTEVRLNIKLNEKVKGTQTVIAVVK